MPRGIKQTTFPFSAEYLRSILDYNPLTGELTWLVDRKPNVTKGKRAGVEGIFRRDVKIHGTKYLATQLIWYWMTGEIPTLEIDHRNRDSKDDRWCNLRLATRSQNMINRVWKKHRNLPVGVYHSGKKYYAQLTQGKRRQYIGTFDTPQQAYRAIMEAHPERKEWSAMLNVLPDVPPLVPDNDEPMSMETMAIILAGPPNPQSLMAECLLRGTP